MRWVMHNKIFGMKAACLLIALLIWGRPVKSFLRSKILILNRGFWKGWLTKGDAANFTIDKTEHYHGNQSARIGKRLWGAL